MPRSPGVGFALILILALTGCSRECAVSTLGKARRTYVKNANRPIDLDLNDALASGDFDRAKKLIANGADVNARFKGEGGVTNLIMAAHAKTDKILLFLLDNGADPNLQDDLGGTPLMVAASNGRLEHVRILLDRGADPNLADKRGRTARSRAAESGRAEIVALLKEHGAR